MPVADPLAASLPSPRLTAPTALPRQHFAACGSGGRGAICLQCLHSLAALRRV